jgi:DNA-binding response OmpR family regulator
MMKTAELAGMRILVVEDNYLVADVLCEGLRECGCEVVGPAPSVAGCEKLIGAEDGDRLHGAVLDVNLGGEFSFPIAARLRELGVPFIFLTGYDDRQVVPTEFQSVRRISKPCDIQQLATIIRAAF